jgi:tripartite-type tricarboxylate transporter receptor subunit TctC
MRVWTTATTIALAMLASVTHADASDNYPNRPITLIVPFSAGSNTDTTSRLVARLLAERLGQTVVVDNRPGASGILGMQIGATAKPDGYTMTLATSGQMATYPHLYKKPAFDPAKAFIAVRASASNPFMTVFNSSKPYKTLPELIAYAKQHPDAINFGSVSVGSAGHLAAELLQQQTGIKMTHVLYRLSPPLINDLISGVLDIGFDLPNALKPQIEAGKMIPIAVATETRMKNFPNVPTFKELGYPDMTLAAWGVYLVPAGTPQPIVEKLDAALADVLKMQTVQDFYSIGDAIVLDIGHDAFPAFLTRESAKMKALVQRSGIEIQ